MLIYSNETGNSIVEYASAFSLYNCINLVAETWENTPISVLKNSWHNLGINVDRSMIIKVRKEEDKVELISVTKSYCR